MPSSSADEDLVAVETKSGQTVADDFFSGLRKFEQLLGSGRRPRLVRPVLVYGGSERQKHTEATVLPWSMIDRYDWT